VGGRDEYIHLMPDAKDAHALSIVGYPTAIRSPTPKTDAVV